VNTRSTRAAVIAGALLILATSSIQFNTSAATPVKSGATCLKLSATTSVGKLNYKCVKSGKKLIWQVIPTAKVTPTPSPKATPTPSPTPSASQSPSTSPSPTPTASATPSPSPTPSPTSARGTGLPRTQLILPSNGVLGLVDKTSYSTSWAQYYGTGLGYKDAFVLQGSTFTLKWLVTDASGNPMRNQAVTLQANKGYGGANATFTCAGTFVSNTSGANDGADIPGTTDSSGYVTFTLTQTSPATEPSSISTTAIDPLNSATGAIYGQFGLQIGSTAQINQSMDIIDLHILPDPHPVTPAPTPTPTPSPSPTPSATYLWAAEFNEAAGTKPDAAVWTPLIGNGFAQLGFYNYGTGEIESNSADAAITDGNGNLAINTTKQGGVWTSSRIWTQGKLSFQYGKIEARIKYPVGSFNWPAFWMLGSNYLFPNNRAGSVPWPNSGEIDISEGLQNNQVDQSTLHSNYIGSNTDWNGGGGLTAVAPFSNISSEFHTHGMLWEPNSISFTLDGVVFAKDTYRDGHIYQSINGGPDQLTNINGAWPFNNPFFLILDNAIMAGVNAPDGTSSQMLIDWIHYSTYNGFGTLSHS